MLRVPVNNWVSKVKDLTLNKFFALNDFYELGCVAKHVAHF